MEQEDRYRRQLNLLAMDYLVPDIVPDTAQMIFILESPHIQELKYMAPVSGSSGLSMSKHLFGQKYGDLPLGRLVKTRRDTPIGLIGLMNVCQIPLQAAAYPENVQTINRQLFALLQRIRTQNNTDDFSDEHLNTLQDILTKGFAKRILRLQERRFVMVPCGRFAQKYFRLAHISSPLWTIAQSVPHPSYNNFDKPLYKEAVRRLKAFFQELVGSSDISSYPQ